MDTKDKLDHQNKVMGEIVEAIYENGVLKPLKKLNLKEGERVKLKIEKKSPKGILKIAQEFKEKIKHKKIEKDPLEVLLEMRNR